MNLVIALLSTRQYLTADRIRESVAGYNDSASDEAFSRMFERDKNELRELGIPLETGQSARDGGADGYRINRDAYELPDIDLTSAEAAAVAVAVQLWESPELTAAAQSAVLKLRAGGVQVDADPPVTAVPSRARGAESTLGQLLAAIDAGHAVRFTHRSAPNTPSVRRDVEPWGVVTDRGRWYLVGHDRERGASRTFRLSRIDDDVETYGPRNAVRKPEGVDLRDTVRRFTAASPVTGSATVWVAKGRGQAVRRLGVEMQEHTLGDRDGTLVEIAVRSQEWLARMIAGHGADALVIAPPKLREAVIARLRSVVPVAEPAR